MPKWTPMQQEAIAARNPQILVSAAAGSGKTAVLIQRILSLLKEGVPLQRMLVLTFTHAAAEEMRQRLTELLGEAALLDPSLKKQHARLGRADISTLHSFCGKLIRRHFQAAQTDPLSKQANEALAGELFERAFDEALDAFYEAPGEEAQALIDRFSEEQILGMARELYLFLMVQDAPFDWLHSQLDEAKFQYLYSHAWYKIMLKEARLQVQGAGELSRSAQDICLLPGGPSRYLPTLEIDQEMINQVLLRMDQDQPFTWQKPSFSNLSGRKAEGEIPLLAEQAKALRDASKEAITKALGLLPQDAHEADQLMESIRETLPQLRALADFTRDGIARYQTLKAELSLWDFADLEHLALKVLQDEGARLELQGSYDAIFVDEYQDISQLQEALIQALRGEGGSLFMVGDVKQSIYRFRLADPGLFLHKYQRFVTDTKAPARLITLMENFRSTPNILAAVNLVFEHAMREEVTEIAYDEQARLRSQQEAGSGLPVELWLVDKGEISDLEALEEDEAGMVQALDEPEEAGSEEEDEGGGRQTTQMERAFVYEARLIARRILELRAGQAAAGQVPTPFRDMAILLRKASGRAAQMAEILSQAGIPTYSDADGSFYAQPEVMDVIALLQVLDNPCQDEALLHSLACPAFGFDPEELAGIRLKQEQPKQPFHQIFFEQANSDPRCSQVQQKLEHWRFLSRHLPLDQFIRLLVRESGLYTLAGAREEGQLRRANLRLLAARATELGEEASLSAFIRRAQNSLIKGTGTGGASLGSHEDVVHIMTLHKSKGLQFPVVFMPDLAASFSRKQNRSPLRIDAKTGLALRQVYPEARYHKPGFAFSAIMVKKKREELAEESRLLYVGMTRAKERLILIGAPDRLDSALARWNLPLSDYAAGTAKCMLDWVCAPLAAAILQGKEGLFKVKGATFLLGFCNTRSLPASQMASVQTSKAFSPGMASDAMRQQLDFSATGPALPQKSSVTTLIRGQALHRQEEETPVTKRQELQLQSPLSPLPSLPRLNEQQALTGAQKGAAAHKVLCALAPGDFVSLHEAALKDALEQAIQALLGRGILDKGEAISLDRKGLMSYFQSELARRMASSTKSHQEWAFSLLVEGGVILQGVLDACFLEEGGWVLVDYKTDHGRAEDLVLKYQDQMRWYIRALRDITGQPVKEAWLYLLRSSQAVLLREGETIRLETTS